MVVWGSGKSLTGSTVPTPFHFVYNTPIKYSCGATESVNLSRAHGKFIQRPSLIMYLSSFVFEICRFCYQHQWASPDRVGMLQRAPQEVVDIAPSPGIGSASQGSLSYQPLDIIRATHKRMLSAADLCTLRLSPSDDAKCIENVVNGKTCRML